MDLQYPGLGNEDQFVQPPSSDVNQSSSPPLSPNAFSQDEPDAVYTHFQVSDQEPSASDFDSDGNAKADLNPFETPSRSDLGDGSVLADSTEFHPLINGTYINCVILQLLNE
jgi:hypothetical protein